MNPRNVLIVFGIVTLCVMAFIAFAWATDPTVYPF